METTANGVMIPSVGDGNSPDKFGAIVAAVISNAKLMEKMFEINGNMPTVQSDYSKGWEKSTNGKITQIGHPQAITMVANGRQVVGQIVFETPFPNVCNSVIGSDAGGAGMSFGFYNLTKTGCTWCTCKGLGTAGVAYSPNYTAVGR